MQKGTNGNFLKIHLYCLKLTCETWYLGVVFAHLNFLHGFKIIVFKDESYQPPQNSFPSWLVYFLQVKRQKPSHMFQACSKIFKVSPRPYHWVNVLTMMMFTLCCRKSDVYHIPSSKWIEHVISVTWDLISLYFYSLFSLFLYFFHLLIVCEILI